MPPESVAGTRKYCGWMTFSSTVEWPNRLKNAPIAVRLTKATLELVDAGLDACIQAEALAQSVTLSSDGYLRGHGCHPRP